VNSNTQARVAAGGYVLADNVLMRAHNESEKTLLSIGT
jgi:hypothetical protein